MASSYDLNHNVQIKWREEFTVISNPSDKSFFFIANTAEDRAGAGSVSAQRF